MAKYCGNCGTMLDTATGLCPNCNQNKAVLQSTVNTDSTKGGKKQTKKAKKGKTKKKKSKKVILAVSIVIGALLIVIGVLGVLFYKGIIEIPFIYQLSSEDNFAEINRSCIEIEELEITMTDDSTGKAKILIRLPDYTEIFLQAAQTENPEQSVLKALKRGKFEYLEFEETVDVTVENRQEVIRSEEIVNSLMEQELIKAVNAVSEGENRNEENA